MERIRHLLHRGVKTFVFLQLLAALPAHAGESTQADLLDKAKDAMRNNDPEAAYQLLSAQEGEYTGSDAYDYLLGLSALDSGRPGEAIFSLQRLAVRNPDFSGARLELARAYYEVGDNELARTEFQRLGTENPPPNVQAMIANYMEAIDARARAYSTTMQYYLDLGTGYDRNPAAATADDQFLSFFLDDKNVEQSSAYADVAAGLVYSKPLTPETGLIVTSRLSHRSHPSAHYVDPTTAEAGAMINWKKNANHASIGLSGLLFRLDGEANKHDTGIMASYGRELSDRFSIETFGRYGQMRFDDDLEIQDVDQWMAGAGIVITGDASQFNLGGFASEDDAKDSASPFSNESVGIRTSFAWIRPGGRSYSIEATAVETEYDDNFFGFNREDDLYSVVAGTTWSGFPSKDWSLTLRLAWSKKDSTVSLYEFDRIEAGITIRKIFE